ncbi:alpha/beta-hydrolase [Annulohypoxylon maeteangense]|uniref:alpha/beta-hydrolase n=1 Tax=Annulohypoxylon maeteangense TaxID=1927788 RepID=UPI002008D991|nr:alpha/beta-hydrolase [Annulohypoxylon maeteangense]KAI0884374.1 alpha/beta-hydrolase [Annulohypoxylon maeteangense]
MLKLSPDESFNFEILRMLSHSSFNGADISECLIAAEEIAPGDFESWYAAWNKRAERVLSHVKELNDPISLRDAYFRASTYSRAADFFLHGNWADPRINSLWKRQADCFTEAIFRLENPGYRKLLRADGFDVPIIVFPAGKRGDETKRPTILMGNGYDGSMEEMYHMHGAAALERGYNVVVYEGPGQPTVRRDQGLGFIHNWEAVVTPVVDYVETLSFVDSKKIGLVGYSMGGYLCARAAAFEPRISAVFQIDGLFDFTKTPIFTTGGLSKPEGINDEAAARAILDNPEVPTGFRWVLGHGLWSFNVKTRGEFLERAAKFSLDNGIAQQIQCPVFVGDPEKDMFFQGQPELMVENLEGKGTLVKFTREDGAEEHCHFGAGRFTNAVMYKWFEDKVVKA